MLVAYNCIGDSTQGAVDFRPAGSIRDDEMGRFAIIAFMQFAGLIIVIHGWLQS